MSDAQPTKKRPESKQNHTIPRMLLNRFAHRIEGAEHYVWQMRRESKPFENNTRRAAVNAYFYGDPANGVETAFSVIEQEQSQAIDRLLAGVEPSEVEQECRQLVWTLAVRTANLRANCGELFAACMNELINQATDEAIRTSLPSRLDEEWEAIEAKVLNAMPAIQARALRLSLERRPGLRVKLRQYADLCLESVDVAGSIQTFLAMAQSEVDPSQIAGRAHVRAFEEGPSVGHVPDAFRPMYWRVITLPQRSVILGDGACFAVNADREPGHLLRFAKDWHEIYLPIAHDRVLVACRSSTPPRYGVDEINQASASLSHEQFFASCNTETEQALQRLIGTGVATMTRQEVREMAHRAWAGDSSSDDEDVRL